MKKKTNTKCKYVCCCNCKNQLKLMNHPMNKGFGEGSISELCGYVCIAIYEDGSNEGKGIYCQSQHGMCELHFKK